MSEASTQVFRFTCPHCQKVLKAPLEWSGKRGVCPGCQKPVTFPKFTAPSNRSRTAEQLQKVVSEGDNTTLEEAESDQMAMLLSLGTCGDYQKAMKVQAGRLFSARQWRRILNSAAARETMRLHIEEQLDRLAEIPDDDDDPAALVVAGEATNPDAWKVFSRYLYFLRHGTCDHCKVDVTGMTCLYLTWDQFTKARLIPADRSANWEKIFKHHLGL
jgi:hypothetical protein